jgi:Fe(3+) dicitrate transport protein
MIAPLLFVFSFSTVEPIDTTLPAPVELESITITSTHSKTNHRSSSELVLPMIELARFNVVDGNTLLQSQPGVYSQQEDGWGLRLNIGIRGTGVERSSRITLMEDGILTAPAAYSAPAAYYSPVLWKYEQIEILKGGAALITGPQSTGGAINFVTATPQEKDYHQIRTTAGAFGRLMANARGQVTLNDRSQIFYGAGRNGAQGFNDIDGQQYGGFGLNDGYLKWIQHLDDKDMHHLEVFFAGTTERSNQTYLGQSLEDALENPNGRYVASALDNMAMERLMTRIGYTLNLKKGWVRADLYRQFVHRNWYKLDKVSDGSTSVGVSSILANPNDYLGFYGALIGTNTDTYTATLKANNRYYLSQGLQFRGQYSQRAGDVLFKHEAGARFHYDHADRFQHRDTYSLTDEAPTFLQAGEAGAAGNRLDAARAASAYARTTASWNTWSVQLGLRGEYIESYRTDWGSTDPERQGLDLSERSNITQTLLPGISLSKEVGNWSLFTGVHQGMTPAGSKEGVLPEQSVNSEFGIQNRKQPIALTVFHSEYARLLGSDAASSGGSGTGELFNGGAAQISGIEGQWAGQLGKWNLQTSATYTRAVFTESFSSKFDGWGNVKEGDILPYLPALQANVQVLYESSKWNTGLQLQALSSRKSASELDEYDLPAALVANYSINYKFSKVCTLQAGIQNITNTRHIVAARPAGYRTFTPRMWTLGLDLDL